MRALVTRLKRTRPQEWVREPARDSKTLGLISRILSSLVQDTSPSHLCMPEEPVSLPTAFMIMGMGIQIKNKASPLAFP
jgi:hypothetical protein